MSRTTSFILIGFAGTLVASLLLASYLAGRAYFIVSDRDVTVVTPVAVAQMPTATNATPFPVEPTITAVVPTATNEATITAATAVPPTAIPVLTTSVQYVLARTAVNIRSGPNTSYNIVGWVAEGQTARVTGVSADNGWWRVVCPDGSFGSCWVTAFAQYTQPASAPVNNPPAPTATNTACTHAATFVADVTVPDGSQMSAASTFVKTWRIQNSGTCPWDGRYQLVHVDGPTLGAVLEKVPLPGVVAPGQTVDLSVTMQAPATPGSYQSNWKLQTPQGSTFGVGRSHTALWVKINVAASPSASTISGLVYQDGNLNGRYDNGETLMASREIWLVAGTGCNQAPVAVGVSGNDGRYTFNGRYEGSFCVGLRSSNGFDEVHHIALAAGQTMNGIDLRSALPTRSITGFVWHDHCLVDNEGNSVDGNCVAGANGTYQADGMLQATESNIPGVTVLLRQESCATHNSVAVSTVTDAQGKYYFGNLTPGTYCVFIEAASSQNMQRLLPGAWTFPATNSEVSQHELTLMAHDNAYAVNFGWDYQFQ